MKLVSRVDNLSQARAMSHLYRCNSSLKTYILLVVFSIDWRDSLVENEIKHDRIRTIFLFRLHEWFSKNF